MAQTPSFLASIRNPPLTLPILYANQNTDWPFMMGINAPAQTMFFRAVGEEDDRYNIGGYKCLKPEFRTAGPGCAHPDSMTIECVDVNCDGETCPFTPGQPKVLQCSVRR